MRATAIKAALAVSSVIAASACDSETSRPASPRATSVLLDSLDVEPAGRSVVAEVNGVPVYADCVKRQAEAHQRTREEALQECIDFELLAQAAHQPRYLELPEVQEVGKQELVRNFIASRYPVRGPADIPMPLVRELWERISPRRYNRPELRDIVFCRIAPVKGEDADEQSQKAARFLRRIYDQFKTRKNIKSHELFGACYGDRDPESTAPRPYEQAGVQGLELMTFSPTPRSRYQEAFRVPVFDLVKEAGTLTAPLQNEYGWDLILITRILPELKTEFADAEAEVRKALFEQPVYEDRRQLLFKGWYSPMEKRHKVARSYDNLPTGGPALSVGPTPPPGPAGGQP